MATYRAGVRWGLAEGEDFLAGRYSRGHDISFEDGPNLPGTASAHVVGNRWSAPGAVDPEQMLVASISTCHMLSFLHVARDAGVVVTSYRDEATGVLEKNAAGKLAVTRVTLRPVLTFAGEAPPAALIAHLHHQAHETCFIANSVATEVMVEAPSPLSPA